MRDIACSSGFGASGSKGDSIPGSQIGESGVIRSWRMRPQTLSNPLKQYWTSAATERRHVLALRNHFFSGLLAQEDQGSA